MRGRSLASALVLTLVAAGQSGAASAADKLYGLPPVPRDAFNRLAAELSLPVFWSTDADTDGVIDPAEVVPLLGIGDAPALVVEGALSPAFETMYRAIAEALRRETVRRELDQGRPTLVLSDLRSLKPHEKQFVQEILAAAELIDTLHLEQRGALRYADQVKDPESRAMFWRDHGPWGVAPETESNPFCNAVSTFPERKWGIYPNDLPHDSALCEMLKKQPNADRLLDPFTVVERRDGKLVAVPYNEAYGKQMAAIAERLDAAAAAMKGHGEEPLVSYLEAAAAGFRSNDWAAADEAWSVMNAENSAWYLRIAPDEVYWDVCQEKAGFHVSFARIDRGSLEWQSKLSPLRDVMEEAMAKLIGAPYEARSVSFHMPDFIQIVVNAGDARSAMGATVGQSLPNWGRVAEEGRGRTVVMTNLYNDPDSRKTSQARAAALLSKASLKVWTEDTRPVLLGIILHEASHNLGPCSDYTVSGEDGVAQDPGTVFGGRMASMLEELKAQTASLWYTEMLRKRGLIDDALAHEVYATSMTWAFSHIARGMFTASGVPKTYSQLAAVQVGFLVDEGALRWVEDPASDGDDVGRFDIDFERMPAAVEKLMRRVGQVKARGDAEGAEALATPYITGDKRGQVHMDAIRERILRQPKATFVYSALLD